MQSKIKLPQDLYKILNDINSPELKSSFSLDGKDSVILIDIEKFLIELDTYILKYGLEGDDYKITDYGIKLYKLYDYIYYGVQ